MSEPWQYTHSVEVDAVPEGVGILDVTGGMLAHALKLPRGCVIDFIQVSNDSMDEFTCRVRGPGMPPLPPANERFTRMTPTYQTTVHKAGEVLSVDVVEERLVSL